MQGRKIILLILFVTLGTMATAQRCNTLKIQIGLLQKKYNVHFIYNSDLKLDVPYQGPALYYKLLPDNLDLLFKNTEIDWKLSEHNISLFKRNKPKKTKIYTICGYIRDINKESLISATIYDHTSKNGTITNEYGFFSLSLPEGKHTLKISYVGYDDKNIDINLNGNHDVNIIMTENNTFDDVIVNGDLNSPLLNTQTGKRTLSSKDLNTEFSLLSSPDVIKTLQRISGVSEGIELASGLYVHGGGNDENLFLLDGTPLYQINHSLGLFSSFNTDIVKNVDFYKSGFPAHYNGRLSSITDIRTIDGNMKHTHGAYSIGLLDGRLFLEGPVVKDKTSYVFGLRRSWLDLFLHPTFALMNKSNKDGDHTSFDYLFHDLNIKITHIFSYKSKIYISLYSGKDKYSIRDKSVWSSFFSDTNNDFNWGNFNVALNWNYQISHKMFMNISEIYSNSHSIHDYSEDETQHRDNIIKRTSLDIQHNRSKIYDMGIKTNFDYRPNSKNRILFGGNYTCHIFKPQTLQQTFYFGDISEKVDTSIIDGKNFLRSHEIALYAEDEWHINNKWSSNIGFNYSMFCITKKNFHHLDPRFSMKYQLNNQISIKASFTKMSQYVHRISNTYLEMPMDYWVPTTKSILPMNSSQIAAGIYAQINKNFLITFESFYKHTNHIIQYKNWMGLQPPASLWDKDVIEGSGKAYGVEFDANYKTSHLTIFTSYTLSWSKRKFNDFYEGWFRDKFDNRHKINLMGRYKLNQHISMYAAWTFHSGNMMTLPTQYANMPTLPGDEIKETGYFYETPNNVSLPDYHRLDIGFDFHKVTKHNHEQIWNISLYNAYCRLNTMYADIKRDDNGNFYAKCKGYIPIIPSISYTIKF